MNKLGKGLSALIPNKNEEKKDNKKNIKVNLKDIHPGKYQKRTFFNDDAIEELAESIKSNGVIQPILIRKKNESEEYEIIAGERRWRASKIAGLEEIPAIILEVNDKTALEVSIIENIQRENLNSVEEASGYLQLIEEFSYTQENLSKIIGKSRSHISNCIRILSLPEEIKDFIKNGFITMGHAKVLVGVENNIKIAKDIIKKKLNVRETEKLIKNLSNTKEKKEKNDDVILLEEKISEKIGLEVKIHDVKDNGKVVVKFKNLDELNKILKRLSSDL